jgi:hypothetical protein
MREAQVSPQHTCRSAYDEVVQNQIARTGAPGFWGRVYNALFRVFGPAQLGDPNEPPPPPPRRAAPCPRCGQPMEEHGYVETAGRRRLRCPDS